MKASRHAHGLCAVSWWRSFLYVRDMDRAVGFYRDTLDLPVAYESAGWTTFRTGACTLALHATERRELGAAEPDPTFLVADAAMERQRLIAAGVDVTEIRRPVVGVHVFDARDPDGNRVSIESRNEIERPSNGD